ncbi:MAG TPA: glycerol-3-phosphate 1-O-acyltransferase PlsY [Coriobacteriia bacterium]
MWLTVLRIAAPLVAGYLLGGIPFGVIIARRFYGIDITAVGSGNTGGTNVYRNLGWKAGVATGVLDVVKAIVAVLIGMAAADPAWSSDARDWLAIGAGLAAVAGHSYSPYFRLRGGKGVATAGGVAIALMPLVAAFLVPFFALMLATVRIVSVSSLAAATVFPFLVRWLYPDRPALTVFAVAAALLVWWRHRSNIARLIKGEEPRIAKGASLKGGPVGVAKTAAGPRGGEDEPSGEGPDTGTDGEEG